MMNIPYQSCNYPQASIQPSIPLVSQRPAFVAPHVQYSRQSEYGTTTQQPTQYGTSGSYSQPYFTTATAPIITTTTPQLVAPSVVAPDTSNIVGFQYATRAPIAAAPVIAAKPHIRTAPAPTSTRQPQNYNEQQFYLWLQGINMEKYFSVFVINGIDDKNKLIYIENMDELQSMDIGSFYDRKILWSHIQQERSIETLSVSEDMGEAICNDIDNIGEKILHYVINNRTCNVARIMKRFDLDKKCVNNILHNWSKRGYLKPHGEHGGYRIKKQYRKNMLRYCKDNLLSQLETRYGDFNVNVSNNTESKECRKRKTPSRSTKTISNYYLRSKCEEDDSDTIDDDDMDTISNGEETDSILESESSSEPQSKRAKYELIKTVCDYLNGIDDDSNEKVSAEEVSTQTNNEPQSTSNHNVKSRLKNIKARQTLKRPTNSEQSVPKHMLTQ